MDKPSFKSITVRAIGEIAIIIVGVLIAFQFENWRIDRDLAEQEGAQLMALRADFLKNVATLEEVISLQEGIVAAQSRLLRITSQLDYPPRTTHPKK